MVALMEIGRKTGNYLQLFSAISYNNCKQHKMSHY